MLNIQTGKDNPILRQKAKKIKKITPKIRELILNMIKTMDAKEGIGLAAPQVGEALRIIVVRIDPSEPALVLINPKIVKKSFKKETAEEGCLSLPDLSIPVKRPVKIKIEAVNINNQPVKAEVEGLLARIIQHEIDHLDGILITDK